MLTLVGVAIVLCGLVVVLVQLMRGDIGIGRLGGESPETRRAVRRAIRDGGTDDAGIDLLARRAIQATPSVRWAKYFFGVMLALSIARLIFGSHQVSQIALQVSQAALWTGLIVLSIVNQRRSDSYRGLTDDPLADRSPPAAH